MEKRYKILRFIGTLYKILGIIVGCLTIIIMIVVLFASFFGGLASFGFGARFGAGSTLLMVLWAIFMDIIILLYGAFFSLGLYAFGELLYLLISVEENTRGTYTILSQKQ